MNKDLQAARKRPKHVRNMYAFLVAFGVTAVITLFWITSLPVRFSPAQAVSQSAVRGNIIDEISAALFALQKEVRHFFGKIPTGDTAIYNSTSTPASSTENSVGALKFMDLNAMVASSSVVKNKANTAPKADVTTAEQTDTMQ